MSEKKFELVTQSEIEVTEKTFWLKDSEGFLVYKEWTDKSGNVIDSLLRSRSGHELEDYDLLQSVQDFIEEHLKPNTI